MLGFVGSPESLLETLRNALHICSVIGLKLNPPEVQVCNQGSAVVRAHHRQNRRQIQSAQLQRTHHDAETENSWRSDGTCARGDLDSLGYPAHFRLVSRCIPFWRPSTNCIIQGKI